MSTNTSLHPKYQPFDSTSYFRLLSGLAKIYPLFFIGTKICSIKIIKENFYVHEMSKTKKTKQKEVKRLWILKIPLSRRTQPFFIQMFLLCKKKYVGTHTCRNLIDFP